MEDPEVNNADPNRLMQQAFLHLQQLSVQLNPDEPFDQNFSLSPALAPAPDQADFDVSFDAALVALAPVAGAQLADPFADFAADFAAIEAGLPDFPNTAEPRSETKPSVIVSRPFISRRVTPPDVIQLDSDGEEEDDDPDAVVVIEDDVRDPPPPALRAPVMLPLSEVLLYINHREQQQRSSLLEQWSEIEKKREKEIKKRKKEEEDEKRRLVEESRRLEARHAKAQEEERQAQEDVERRKKKVAESERSSTRAQQKDAAAIADANKEIERLQNLIEEQKRKQTAIMNVADRRSRVLEQEKGDLKAAKELVETKRKEREAAAVEVDEAQHSQSLRYSRACNICLTENPRRRVVFVACGHQTCVNCADKLDKTATGAVSCPFCRKSGTYVKTFEDLETPQPGQGTSEGRKRRNDEADGPEAKRHCLGVDSDEFQTIVNNLFPVFNSFPTFPILN